MSDTGLSLLQSRPASREFPGACRGVTLRSRIPEVHVLRWGSYLAMGDSFTEGVDDPHPAGHYRGWADRFAEHLAAGRPDLRYANLAVRGKLLREIVDQQLPPALRARPELVTLAG